MEFDPLSRDIAPPRHEIESDSEDEIQDGSESSQRQLQFTPPKVQVMLDLKGSKKQLFVFQSEGGEAFLRTQANMWREQGKLMVNGEQHGAFAVTADKSTVILLLRPSIAILRDQACYAYICSAILENVEPSSLTIIDDYNSALYLSSQEVYDAPIRYVSSLNSSPSKNSQAGLELFESPNYVLGLGATMMNESCLLGIPAILLLLPQAINSHMQTWSRVQVTSSSLDTQPNPLEKELTSRLLAHLSLPQSQTQGKSPESETRIDHFLHARRSQGRRKLAESVSAMYV